MSTQEYAVPFGRDGEHGWSSMECPVCGYMGLHLDEVQKVPDEKGSVLHLRFFCECGHRFFLTLDARKGAVMTTWRRLPDWRCDHV
jgi:hypothetical protein